MHSINISNNRIKEIVKLHTKKYRDEYNLYILEGFKAIEEAINTNQQIIEIYSIKDKKLKNKNISVIDEDTMKKISTTSSACEILAIAKKENKNISTFNKYNKLALFENISDPGNLGTIIRSASAFGIEGIILFKDCVDLYSPKVIRSCAGNFFKTPIAEIKNINELKTNLKNHKFISTSISKRNNISLKECSKINKFVIMFGSEANGLSKELTELSDRNIKLEMKNNVESLNLAVSASIIFYEINSEE